MRTSSSARPLSRCASARVSLAFARRSASISSPGSRGCCSRFAASESSTRPHRCAKRHVATDSSRCSPRGNPTPPQQETRDPRASAARPRQRGIRATATSAQCAPRWRRRRTARRHDRDDDGETARDRTRPSARPRATATHTSQDQHRARRAATAPRDDIEQRVEQFDRGAIVCVSCRNEPQKTPPPNETHQT